MSYLITNTDLAIITKNNIEITLKIEVSQDSRNIIGVIQGNIISGEFNIDASSDSRRNCKIELLPNSVSGISLNQDGFIWLDKTYKIYIGVKNQRNDFVWYSQGIYYCDNTETTYDTTTNILNLQCTDFISKLDGTKNGYLGALTTTIPAYIEKKDTGEIVKYNIIRDVVIQILKQLAHIENYMIDDMGEYKAMPNYNSNWANYREEHPLWNTVPYDLDFDAGCTIFSMLSELRDFYPNYEMFFDTEGTFICQMIPSCYQDDLTYSNEFLRKILISEDFSIDMSSVRNMCMVWGNVIKPDFYTETCSYANNIYSSTVENYESYRIGDTIAVKIPSVNNANCFLKINGLDAIPIYDEVTGAFISKDVLQAEEVYVFKIKYLSQKKDTHTVAYLQGQWQVQAMNVLVDGTENLEEYTLTSGKKVSKYSQEYFQDVYNCKTVSLTVIPDSPFTVQKLGEILDVKTGEEYSNIQSDSLALARAEYENWKNCRLTDAITIKTVIVPFADVNVKCAYQRSDMEYPQQYIMKSVSHNFSEGTTTWSMYRFYPLYQDTLDAIGTHKTLSEYKHGLLGKYTHDQLTNFVSGGIY